MKKGESILKLGTLFTMHSFLFVLLATFFLLATFGKFAHIGHFEREGIFCVDELLLFHYLE